MPVNVLRNSDRKSRKIPGFLEKLWKFRDYFGKAVLEIVQENFLVELPKQTFE